MNKRYRRKRSSKVLNFDSWNFDAEPGDLMVDYRGKLFRLEQSSGWGKRNAGELTPREIKPPKGCIAVILDNEIYWQKKEEKWK